MKQIRENKFVLPNFAKLLKSIGEKTAWVNVKHLKNGMEI
jgi:hypothetical protein